MQSKEFFTKVKATRGDVNNWVPLDGRDENYFKMCDLNEVLDNRLKSQNDKFDIAKEIINGNSISGKSTNAKTL